MDITQLSPEERALLVSYSVRGSTGVYTFLSEQEWRRVVDIVKTHRLPVTMCAMVYGFGIEICDHPAQPGDQPRMLVRIAEGRLPKSDVHMSDVKHAREVAALLTHTAENREILAYYRLDQKEDPVDNCY
jgi:hypothetical protein